VSRPVRIAFATSSELPDSTADDRPVLEALRARGVEASSAIWDAPGIAWEGFDIVVLRSTWDYQHKGRAFPDWIERVAAASRLWNPAPMVRWNYDKRYLIDLARAGFDVVPTERLERGSSATLRSVLEARGWPEVVVKPSVGAAGHDLRRFAPSELAEGEAHLARLLAKGDVLVQPFQAAARHLGERSLVFLDGAFSHAIAHPLVLGAPEKRPSPFVPDRALLEPAARIVAWMRPVPLYARVDLLPDGLGGWRLGELELIEPELFIRIAPAAAPRFAEAILRKLESGPERPR
jgi:hypothetical protein